MTTIKSSPYWYARHYKDYAQDTSHLSIIEHGAYTLLLDQYYLTGKPLSSNFLNLARQMRCISRNEKQALKTILDFYFVLEIDGYHNHRADIEIKKRREVIEKRAALGKEGAEKRWQKLSGDDGNSYSKSHSKQDGKPNSKSMQIQIQIHKEDLDTNVSLFSEEKSQEKPKQEKPKIHYQEIVDLYHLTLPTLPAVKVFSDKRKKMVSTLCTKYDKAMSIDWWRNYFARVAESEFLLGSTNWCADFEFLTNYNNMIKVIEGKYHAK